MIQDFKEDMMKTFEMSDLGLMHFFLGIEINQEKEGIFICQKKYTETLLKKFKMESCKTITTPLVTGKKYQKEDGSKSRWLHVQKSHWKPTISNCHKTRYYVRHKSAIRFMQSLSQVHYAAAKRNLSYLRGTKDFGIWYKSTNDAKLVGYTDSDWAGSVDDMKSTSGYTFSLGSGIFSWASKKQATVAQSSAEAEYIATAATSNQAIWLRRILEYIGEKQEEPTTIYCETSPIYKLQLASKHSIVISSPALIKELVRDQATIFANRNPPIAAVIITGGVDIIWTPYGRHCRDMRKLFVREMLSNNNLQASYALRKEEVAKVVRDVNLKLGKPIEIGELVFLTELNVILSLLWGETIDEEKRDKLGAQFWDKMLKLVDLLGKPNVSDFFPILAKFDVQGIEKETRAFMPSVEEILDTVIDERTKMMAAEGVNWLLKQERTFWESFRS
ncbi:UNVERIFIED_CONTAM: Secreted RxLR effector protein [Sesamum angustifolium]|uniref:Secreted RxLR effector protein n=1 Tax=Sesamum angustifolium TaxID=2727405 RepID=A0AAW2M4S4_9LAMI